MNKHLVSLAIGLLILVLADARAANEGGDANGAICSKILQFPTSPAKKAAQEVLPPELQNEPLSRGMRHIVELAMNGTKKKIDGKTFFLIPMDQLDPVKIGHEPLIVSKESLHLPDAYLTAQDLTALRPQVQKLGFAKVFDTPFQIPILETVLLPQVRLEGYAQRIAVTGEGHPVMLENIPVRAKMERLEDRASAIAVLAGIKILSDKRVLPKLLGVTKMEDGSLKAVFPLPAGYECVDLATLTIGLKIKLGLRHGKAPENFEQEAARIEPFENLIERLMESGWPMQNYSLNLENLLTQRQDFSLSDLIRQLKLPIWEFQGQGEREPFLFPVHIAASSAWLPSLFSNPTRLVRGQTGPVGEFEITTISTDKSLPITERLIHTPLQPIEPTAKFGRITLQRFEFFSSLMNGRAKASYLEFLLEKSPAEQENLMELIEYMSAFRENAPLAKFLVNYKAQLHRKSFQVIDGDVK